jgi:hypothetical protein
MKVEKNSPLAQMLLKLAAEHDPKLREAIRNGEVEGVNIIAVGGAPDGEVKELLESLAKDEDDCKNCENRDGCEDAKAATPCDDAEDADDDISIVDEIRSIADDPDIPESIAAPARVVLAAAELMDILNPVPRMVSPERMRPYSARRAAMLADVSAASAALKPTSSMPCTATPNLPKSPMPISMIATKKIQLKSNKKGNVSCITTMHRDV